MLDPDQRMNFRGDQVAWARIGRGPPLVLIHGTPFSSQVWRRIAPHLTSRYTVYYFDLLGYGQSTMREGQDVSLGVQNVLFAALLKHWGIEMPVVIAHDFGGATALRAHYLNGEIYSRLILIDPVALAPWGSPFVQHVRKHEEAFSGLPAYAHRALLKAYLAGAAHGQLTSEAEHIYARPWLEPVGQPAFYRQIAQMDQKYTDEVEPLYAPMPFPTTLLWGAEDQWIPLETGRRLAEKLTRGQLTVVQRSGHLMQEDAPEAIVAAIFAEN
jgi:pimeloyl-ACP methyl ester carboxylesterase